MHVIMCMSSIVTYACVTCISVYLGYTRTSLAVRVSVTRAGQCGVCSVSKKLLAVARAEDSDGTHGCTPDRCTCDAHRRAAGDQRAKYLNTMFNVLETELHHALSTIPCTLPTLGMME